MFQKIISVSLFILIQIISGVQQVASMKHAVARAIPMANLGISGTAIAQFPENSRLKCMVECTRLNCSSFNHGSGECHLHNTYVCEDIQSLVVMTGFKYYDVEVGNMIQFADTYRTQPDCVTLGRCSPKCYLLTTTPGPTTATSSTSTTTSTTTTTTPATTTPPPTTTSTTTTPPPTTTSSTTTTPPPTTTSSTTTTPPPTTTSSTTSTSTPTTASSTTTTPPPTTTASTTTTPPPTTTTTPTTTVTTTTLAPTTTSPSTTTSSAPGPGDVNYACTVNANCTKPNSNCRSGLVCECVAGYSYNPATKTCVTSCPGALGTTFTKTIEYYILGLNIATTYVSVATCKSNCLANPSCLSFDFDTLASECNLAAVTKYGNEGLWLWDAFFEYYQRNCA